MSEIAKWSFYILSKKAGSQPILLTSGDNQHKAIDFCSIDEISTEVITYFGESTYKRN